jgi:hypothetical protein
MLKNRLAFTTSPISYFVAVVSTTAAVESAGFAVESVDTTVESFVSFAVEPEPHAANVNATVTANNNVVFFI